MTRSATALALLVLTACDPEVSTNRGESAVNMQDAAPTPQDDASLSTPDASIGHPDGSSPDLARVTGVDTSLNLRSGPSTNDAILTSIPLGCLVTLLGETNGDWFKVDYRGTVGWCFNTYLETVPAGTADCQ